jgi:hypothetical protein
VRTLIAQLSSFIPDMVIANFTYMNRKEYNSDDIVGEFIGPWMEDDFSKFYYAYYEDQIGFIDTVKNLILLQEFCRQRSVPLFWSWLEIENLDTPRFLEHPVCSQIVPLLDISSALPFSFAQSEVAVDLAIDGVHPGPRSNEIFSELLAPYVLKTLENPGRGTSEC